MPCKQEVVTGSCRSPEIIWPVTQEDPGRSAAAAVFCAVKILHRGGEVPGVVDPRNFDLLPADSDFDTFIPQQTNTGVFHFGCHLFNPLRVVIMIPEHAIDTVAGGQNAERVPKWVDFVIMST